MPIAAGILATETTANCLSKAAGMLRFVARFTGQFFDIFLGRILHSYFFSQRNQKLGPEMADIEPFLWGVEQTIFWGGLFLFLFTDLTDLVHDMIFKTVFLST